MFVSQMPHCVGKYATDGDRADKISTVAIGGVFTHAMGHLRNKHRTPSSFEEQEKKYKKVNTQAHLQLSHSNDK